MNHRRHNHGALWHRFRCPSCRAHRAEKRTLRNQERATARIDRQYREWREASARGNRAAQ